MQLHCPCCHAAYSLEALVQDEEARALFALRAELPPAVWPRLISYLGLFRSEKRALSWDRAARLAREVAEFASDPAKLEAALAETVEAMRLKRDAGDKRPLKNHNYLKRVLENVSLKEEAPGLVLAGKGKGAPSRRVEAMAALTEWAGDNAIRSGLAQGLQALVALCLRDAPAADTITGTADIWLHVLARSGCDIPQVDAERLQKGFSALLAKRLDRWPDPAALVDLLPRRPPRAKLEVGMPSEDEREKGRQAAANLRAALEKGEKP